MSGEGKKVSRRKFLYAAGAVVAAAVIGSVAYFVTRPTEVKPTTTPTTPRKKKIVYWYHETPSWRVARYNEINRLFMETHPDIEVESVVMSWDEAYVKYPAALEAGTEPDFCFTEPTFCDLLVNEYNCLLPVDDIYKEIDSLHKYRSPEIGRHFYFKGHYWLVPYLTIGQLVYYNTAILDKYGAPNPPDTWEKMIEAGQKCYDPKNGIYGWGLPVSPYFYSDQVIYNFFIANETDFIDEKWEPAINNERTIECLETYVAMAKTGPPDITRWQWGDEDLAFATGKIMGGINFTCTLDAIVKYNPGIIGDFKVMRMPKPKGGPNGGIVYPQGACIFKAAEKRGNLDAVYEFIRFVMEPEINAYLLHCDPVFLPVTRDVTEPVGEAPFWNDPRDPSASRVTAIFKDIFLEAIELTGSPDAYCILSSPKYPIPPFRGKLGGSGILREAVQRVYGGQPAAEVAAWMEEQVRKIISEYKK